MEAPPISKAPSPTPSGPGVKGSLYLQPRTKIGILSACLTLMIAASVYAVLQSVNPDPLDTSLSARLLYPRETNPYARLQGVRCANDYACRLNSVAVNGAGDLPEVWAVGNVGLVLHRKAGQTRWEQLPITATEERASAPPPTPTPTPVAKAAASPRPTPVATPTPVPTATPVPTPTPGVPVPYLIGLRLDEAQKIAAGSGLQLGVEYEGGRAPSPAQQGPAPDYRVVKQLPEPRTLVQPESTIKVTLGLRPTKKASLLDEFESRVYAAEPERQQQNAPQDGTHGSASQPPGPSGLSSAGPAQPGHSTLDDDLIYIVCYESIGCGALGRSGRIYKPGGGSEWRFIQAAFWNQRTRSIDSFTLKNMGGSPTRGLRVLAQIGTETFYCDASLVAIHHLCISANDIIVTKNGDLVWDLFHFSKGPTFYTFGRVNPNKPATGLLVGDSGLIAKMPSPQDAGKTLPSIASGTTAALRSFSFESSDSNKHGFIVGDHSIILSTRDGGNTWQHETQGPEGSAPNHRFPAVWYWMLASLLIVTCSVVVAIPAPPPPSEFSVADWTVTDAPLKPGDVDSLGFTPMALGLSRFIRNPKTQPPVTIAIEGQWGEGKSSVMALLRGDLEKSRFRPVWFNAWHHQSEEQLLAALLEHIKDQAVPPWWHIDNWVFRARLLYIRFQGKWPLLILLGLAFCGSIAYEITRHGLKPEELLEVAKDAIMSVSKMIRYLLSGGKEEVPGDLGHFGVAVTLIATCATIFKQAQAFGINPAKLTDNLRDATTIKNIKTDPGVRPRFAREFGDVCKAWSWGGRRVIVFIDDLDRCRPESVVTVLESINFLTTAGDCMMVLGMAQNQVTHCVGLGFKDIAHAEAAYKGTCNTEQEQAVARFNYGAFYIKKLVNIVAPLPKTTPDQRRRVLEARAAEVRRQAEEEEQQASRAARWRAAFWGWASQAGTMTLRAAPVLALVVAVVLSVVIGYKEGIKPQPLAQQSQGEKSSTKTDSSSTPQPTPDKGTAAKVLPYDRPTSQPATLVEPSDTSAGGVWWSFAADVFFLLIIFGIMTYQFSARTNQDAQNSPEFEESLKLWGQYIVGVCDTPREIKRALNDLRYQAMTRRSNGPSTTRGERLIRAMRQFVTGRAEKIPIETRVDEAALPPHKAADLAALSDEELRTFLDPDKLDLKGSENLRRLIELKREHLRRFHRWIGEAKPVTEPTGVGAENPPPARAAQA